MAVKAKTQEEKLQSMMRLPIPKKRVGIVHMQMVKESQILYGMKRFSKPREAVEMVRPLFHLNDREMVLVMSLNTRMEPQAVEIVAVGGLNACMVDLRNIFKHSIINNAAYIVCFHNHPSGDPYPSLDDRKLTTKLEKAGALLDIPLVDHIIIGETEFYSFREHGNIELQIPDDAA